MKILLTGVTGYIGQDVYGRLVDTHDVYVVVRRVTEDIKRRFSKAALIIEWDLASDATPKSEMPDDLDCILHMAQSRHYRDFPTKALDVVDVNVTSTARLLDYASRLGVKNFCHVSSGSVYEPYAGSLSEDEMLNPASINGCTNAAAEMLVLAYRSVMNVSSLRLFMPYGPGQTERLLPGLIERVKTGTPVDLAGGVGLIMAPLYIDDTSDILIRASLDGWSGIYNVAGPESLSLREIVEHISKYTGVPLILNETDGEPLSLVPPLEKLSGVYSFENLIPFKQGLQATIDAHGVDTYS